MTYVDTFSTHAKSLGKEFSEILIFENFGFLKTSFDLFFDADSELPHMMQGKMQPWGVEAYTKSLAN